MITAIEKEVWGLLPAQWDVIGVILTGGGFLIAGVAAFIAARQLGQTEQTRIDQSRPYVMVTSEVNPVTFSDLDIVIQNVGAGPARDVRIEIDPPLKRVRELEAVSLANARIFTEPIPLLPPSYSLRTFFDSAIERHGEDMPSSHTVRVRYHDGHGHEWDERTVMDVDLLGDLLFTERLSEHHTATALRDVVKLLKKQERHLANPIHVTVERRAKWLQRVREEREARRRSAEETVARYQPGSVAALPFDTHQASTDGD